LTVRYPGENTRNPKIQAILYRRREKNQPVSLDSYQKFRYKKPASDGTRSSGIPGILHEQVSTKKRKTKIVHAITF